jgi:hypothetical protein
MAYSVGKSTVANYANTSSGKVTNVVADNGVGGSGEVVNVVDRVALSFVIATNMQYPTINVSAIPGYIAGKSDLVITVNAGVYVYGYSFSTYNGFNNSPFSASMNILGGTTGDTIKLVNNGYILGAGGDGGGAISGFPYSCCCNYGYSWTLAPSTPGQAAIEITYPLILENNGYIAGGGGGGGVALPSPSFNFSVMGGGGGAGGGLGVDRIGTVSTRAVPPNVGNNGTFQTEYFGPCACTPSYFISGGGGGFVLPGVGGLANTGYISTGNGGGSGGAGSAYSSTVSHAYNNNGGTANGLAPIPIRYADAVISGGGGGWGASGAQSSVGSSIVSAGEAGGNSIITNGNAITTITAGTQYGTLKTNTTTYVTTLNSSATTTTVSIPSKPTGEAYTDAIIIIPAGVTLRSNNVTFPALYVETLAPDPLLRLKIIVNGAILGKGGSGGSEGNIPEGGGTAIKVAAFTIDFSGSTTIDCTYGYVAGGGGGGGYVNWTPGSIYYLYGGGGAGGGDSGNGGANPAYGATTVGTSGNNGTTAILCGSNEYISGGGGGLILPGTLVTLGTKTTAGAFPGIGGSGGGSGAARKTSTISTNFINNGGGFNQAGGTQNSTPPPIASGGGGGGWGGNGGSGKRQIITSQSGGSSGVAFTSELGLPVYVINPANVAGQVI